MRYHDRDFIVCSATCSGISTVCEHFVEYCDTVVGETRKIPCEALSIMFRFGRTILAPKASVSTRERDAHLERE